MTDLRSIHERGVTNSERTLTTKVVRDTRRRHEDSGSTSMPASRVVFTFRAFVSEFH
jgi:hypothetical protein